MSTTYLPIGLRWLVTERAEHRCEYCQTQELIVGMPLEVEHVIPEMYGGSSEESNLSLACPRCNRYKGVQTAFVDEETGEESPLFHPRH